MQCPSDGAPASLLRLTALPTRDGETAMADVTGSIAGEAEAGTMSLEIGEASSFELAVLPHEERPPVIGISTRTKEEAPAPQN